jgi:iduronate 2-sulfatase
MGVSVRTADVRLTEWRDWKSGQVVASELYDHRTDEVEKQNSIDQPTLSSQQSSAARLLREQFPIRPHL